MKSKIILSALVAFCLIALVSCKDEKEEEIVTTPKTETTSNTTKIASNLNPEHGLPGHRCDLPVGASLDQAPKKQIQQNNDYLRTNKYPVDVKKNPPHGQPGHDCSKPVGADLK